MVATRRGARADSPSKTNQEKPTLIQAAPSTGRRTRSAAKQVEGRVQQTLEETCSRLSVTPATSTKKQRPRALKLHSPELPSTPVGSAHEADVSDGESVCSAASITEPPVTRSRGRSRLPRARNQENEEISEVESCSSVVSASKAGLRSSTRRKAAPQRSDSAPAEAGDVKPESCSSATSQSQRVTRSQRKPPRTRSSAKRQAGDSEVSDTDSCTSSISARVSRRKMHPIPFNLDELSESSASPLTGRQTRSTGRKTAATLDVTESPSCDSEGFESGPSYSLSTRRKGKTESADHKAVDLESDEMEVSSSVGSPGSTRSRGTPSCSWGAPASRRSARKRGGVSENASESAEKDGLLNDSRLESTMIAVDGDCTLLEEDQIQTSEGVNDARLCSKDETNISDDDPHAALSASVCAEEAETESAVITKDQEEALSAEDKDKDVSDMETMQETVSPSERAQPCPSVTATICERASETTGEAEEKQDAAVGRSEEEEGVSRLKTAPQQVVDVGEAQTEAFQVPSEWQTTADSDSEQKTKDSVVQSTKKISLLDSSDDGDFGEEEESEESEEEEERRGGPSSTPAASVEGLFMIDTRPGQDADEQYYREEEEAASRRLDQEEEDEEFVDEEGSDDDDEDTKILLSSRSSHITELSSRIDPGIRVKELGGLYISFDGSKSKPVSSSLQKLKEKKNLDEVMKKSVIGADFEKKDAVPPYSESKQALKLKHRAEREKSTGNGWFNMKAPEVTQELKGDLRVLKMRGSLDPKRFYKKNDRDGFPKYFQIGTVVDNPADFYHSHVPKKERKRTMVEELLADAEFRQKNKKRYQQIMAEKATDGAGKKRRRKKKFHKK
ncbi:deoxynucleotidyltransferase terminal-interacting protein 2 [Kryptolebias marmoratus]|uniref:Deoxynucleotidyltransferase, terminal, interacting protein 2 n=1 Tax=Kryptolebias marmoratus TaxID=37003 RepID=A0A3Q3BKU6_KRYMA|nr:deoxynucleotidyltransferase terminal-interacting protein 2 [Kryptolebias marmoratus]